MPAKIESIEENVVCVDAAASLSELLPQLGDRELLVEPLSATQPLAEFLAEGGLGYGAATEGSFAASICRIKTESIDYGSDYQALYNVGYPLQRMAEGNGSQLTENLGTARELTLYVRPTIERVAVAQAAAEFPADAPADVLDFVVLNDAAARLLGLEGACSVGVYPANLSPATGQSVGNFWDKRFIIDRLPEAEHTVKLLTQRSSAKAAFELARAADCAFVALFVYTGVLVVLSGKVEVVEPIEKLLLNQPLTWPLGAAPAAAADELHGH